MSTEENKSLIRRYWQDASEHGILGVLDDYFAPDIVAHPPASASPEPLRGRDAWRRFTRAQWGAFPDLTVSVEDLIAEGDRVALRLKARGTHAGPLMGLPPTGKPVRFAGMEFFRIRDGKIAEAWGQFDGLGLLQQLGALPGPEGRAPDDDGAETPATAERGGSPEANKTLARRYADTLLNRHELERTAEVLAPDFVGHFAGDPGPVCGIAAWQEMFGGFLAAFPDYRETVHEVLAEGDRVAARITFFGTHRGSFMGLPPSGKEIAVGGMAFLRIAGGRIAEQWTQADLLGLLQQIGAMPTPGPPTA